MILAIVANSSSDSQENIQRQMFLMNCPEPSYDGQYNATNVSINGFSVLLGTNNSTNPYMNNVTFGGNGTVFRCYVDTLSSGTGYTVTMSNKDYQEVTLGFPSGWFKFAGDFIGQLFKRITELFIMIGFFVTPSNFNILGYTLDDISGLILLFVISLYAICYIAIAVLIYKVISPFSGAG